MSGDFGRCGAGPSRDDSALSDALREELWDDISRSWDHQAARRRRARAAAISATAALALAAVLAVGIFIGRVSNGPPSSESRQAAVPVEPSVPSLANAYRVAVGEHLKAAETLVKLFESTDETDASLARLARDLAVTSRLLADSRAGENPEMRRTLLDLELLLVQIARVVDESDATEREVVREGLRDSTVLPRLRRGVPDEPAPFAI
jgi:ABC-type transporter Mla subunit MlaD